MKQNVQKSANSNFKKLQINKWNLILFLMFHPAPSHNVPSDYIQPTHLPGHRTRNPKVIGHSRQLIFQLKTHRPKARKSMKIIQFSLQ